MIKNLIISLLLILPAFVETDGKAKKDTKGIITVITYDKAGKLLHKGFGFFISEKGDAISAYAFFNGASRAEVVDGKGKKWNVKRIQGASDIYDIVKFSTDCEKSEMLPLATTTVQKGATVTRFMNNGKGGLVTVDAKVVDNKTYDNLAYYTISSKADNQSIGTPILGATGEVVAVMQKNAEKDLTKCFAVDIAVEKLLSTSAISAGLSSLNSIYIPKQLPSDTSQAASYLYLLSKNAQDTVSYLTALADFRATFPELPTAYVEHAAYAAGQKKFAEAEADYNEAFKAVKNQAEVHYNFSKLLYRLNLYKSYKKYKDWDLNKALDEAKQAYSQSPIPIYKLQQGDCYYALKQYQEAFKAYQELNSTPFASAQTFYYAAKSREMWDNDTITVLALLDSTMARFNEPYQRDAGPFLLQRAQIRSKYGKYREAAIDYDAYEKLFGTKNLNDNFFYMKEQTDLAAGLYPWALTDIEKALAIRPNEYLYVVEKAMLHLRVGNLEEAVFGANQALKLDPEGSDAYKILGIAYGQQKEKKNEALKYLRKAKELGDPQVDEWIEKLK